MSTLAAIAYPDPLRAGEVKNSLVRLQTEHLIDLEDAVWVERRSDGKVKLHQSVNLAGAGAVGGLFWSSLVGLLFANPLLGGVIGAGPGALSGSLSDYGIDDNFIRELAAEMKDGSSAIFVLIRRSTPDKVLEEVGKFGGTVIRSSLTHEQETKLQSALTADSASQFMIQKGADTCWIMNYRGQACPRPRNSKNEFVMLECASAPFCTTN